MPRSKRDKKISLTQTKKKGLVLKQKVLEEVRTCADKYARIFTFSTQNMRNNKLKDVRQEWKQSRFYFGKNKVMALALGTSKANEYRDGLFSVSKLLQGQRGLLFTDKSKQEVLQWFSSYSDVDYARSGNVATQTVVIEQGPLKAFSHSMEPQLRQLGLPTALKRGVVTLLRDFTVCEKGRALTPEQARILKLFGHQMANFHIDIDSMWSSDGSFEKFKTGGVTDLKTPKKVRIKPREPISADAGQGDDEVLGFESLVASDGDESEAEESMDESDEEEDEEG